MLANREDLEIPDAGAHIWDWFWDLNKGRQVGMSGYLPLPAFELRAWAEMTGNIVRPEEWRILREMDGAFLAAVANRSKDGWVHVDEEMTPEIFDAVFQ
ncbi:MAG TPA: hypothetical protein VGN98_16105 [Tianweitania sediminis]|jgi:hypothetical protein|nr:hypothetical protein [Tianweitania sediminis]